jgi:hypothetical protein
LPTAVGAYRRAMVDVIMQLDIGAEAREHRDRSRVVRVIVEAYKEVGPPNRS